MTVPSLDSRPRTLSLQASPAVVVLCRSLLADVDRLADRLGSAILEDNPAYAAVVELGPSDLTRSCHDNLCRVLQVLSGTGSDDDLFDAPHRTGRLRAEQGVRLEAVLHAYRLGFRTIWEALVETARADEHGDVDSLVGAATEVWEVVHRFSSEVAKAYRATEEGLASRDERRRAGLLDALLDGSGLSRSVLGDASATLDLPEQGRYAVVALDGTDTGLAAAPALAARGLRSAWRARAGREIGVVLLGRADPEDVVAALSGVAGARGGVSPAVDGLCAVATATRLAETALRALPAASDVVAELDARLPGALLVSAPDLADRLVTRALGGVLALESDERGLLLDTLRAWLATGGSAGQTAGRLSCHRNTVLNRLRRLEALTGRSVERVDDLVEWSLALLSLDVQPDRA